MSVHIEGLVDRLYAALAQGDGDALLAVLAPGFVGHFCGGMPAGAGTAEGADAARSRWWDIGAAFAVRPEVEERIPCVDGRLLVRGTYRGKARADGHQVEAVFCHLWTAQDGRLIELRQVTDTARW